MFKEDLAKEELRESVRMSNHFDFLRDTCATVLRATIAYWGIYVFVSAFLKDVTNIYCVIAALLGYKFITLKELRYSGKAWLFTKKEYGQVMLFSIGFLLYNVFLTICLWSLIKLVDG